MRGYYSTTNLAVPAERRRGTFLTFAPEVVITATEMVPEVRALCPSACIIDIDDLGQDELSAAEPPHRLAYVMFTSGTTGVPKGVMISQDALSHYVAWMLDAMRITPEDRWSQHPNIAFDLAVMDIFGALCAGAALIPITTEDLLMPARAIRRHALTIWNSVPSVLTSMIKIRQVTEKNFESLRLLTFCGEPLQTMHLDTIFNARPNVIVHNTYGPTEATVSCTLLRLDAENYREACGSSVAIGAPIKDMSIDLIGGADANEGEIVISGPQLADGYLNDPDLTGEKFRTYLKDGIETRGYFTGDWAYRSRRHVFFRGRMDNQVKIRGERIELEDISAVLMTCGYGFACVLLIGEELHAVFEYDGPLKAAEALRQELAQLLPAHLVPRTFHALSELPRSPNGKVDANALRQRLAAATLGGSADPRTT